MKSQQKMLYGLSELCIVLIFITLVLEWKIDKNLGVGITFFSGHRDFMINLCMGLAGGCLVSAITAWITLTETIRERIGEMLFLITRVKLVYNQFAIVRSKEEFLEICAQTENLFNLLQKNYDVFQVWFLNKKEIQKMLEQMHKYIGIVLTAMCSAKYPKDEDLDYQYEIADILSVGEIALGICLCRWSNLSEKYLGKAAKEAYCSEDESIVSFYTHGEGRNNPVKSIKELIEDWKECEENTKNTESSI